MNNENELWYPLRRNSFEYALSPILSKDEQKPAPEEVKPAPVPAPAPAPAAAPAVPEEKLPSLEDPAPAKESKAKSFHTASMQEESAEAPKRPAPPSRPMPAPAPSAMKKPEINTEAPASVQETNGSAEKKRNMRLAVLALCIVLATTAAVVCVSKFGKRLPKAEESVSDSRKDKDDERDDSEDSRPDAEESATDASGEQNSAVDSQPQAETGASSETMPSTDSAQDPTDPQGGTETQAATEGEIQPDPSESSKVMFKNLHNQEFLMIEDMTNETYQLYYTDHSAGEVENQDNLMGSYNMIHQNDYRDDYKYTGTGREYHSVDMATDIVQNILGENNTDNFGDYEEEPKCLYQFTDINGNVYLGRQVTNFKRRKNEQAENNADWVMFENWKCNDILMSTDSTSSCGFILFEDANSCNWEYRETILTNGAEHSSEVLYNGTYEKIGTQLYIFRDDGNEVFRLWCEENGEVFLLEYQRQ